MRTVTLLVAVAVFATAAARAQDMPRTAFRVARDAGCMICHDVESPERGAKDYLPKAPSFQAVACRYRSNPNAASQLSSVVREGSGPLRRDRHWTGQVAFDTMYPNDVMVGEAETRQIVDWILTLCPKSASAGDGHNQHR
jgi:cytochrome c551/c552